jgi:hypothetical protein
MSYAETITDFTDLTQESVLERFLFPAYLAFSVCFYSLRFLFGWGDSGTTRYESDMPGWLAATKDILWVGMIGAALCSRSIGKTIEQVRRHPFIYLLLGSFCTWMLLCAFIHSLFHAQPLDDSLMFNVRKPLEYIPAALLAPAFIGSWRRVGTTWKRLNWLAIGFAAFEIVSVVGGWKQTGFDWGGAVVRYGGILGSPNDWGIYSGCAIVAVLAVGKARAQAFWFFCSLLLTQSRSSMVGLVAGVIPLLYLPAVRQTVLRTLLILFVLAVPVYFLIGSTLTDQAVEHFGLDESALTRVSQAEQFSYEFVRPDSATALLFGVKRFDIEASYLWLFVRGGVPAFTLYLGAIVASLVRGWKLRKASVPHLVALVVVILISTASIFITFPDAYPTNFYLWLAVGVLWMEPVSEDEPSPSCGQLAYAH